METFEASSDHGGTDGRGVRYLEWTWDPYPNDTWTVTEYGFLLLNSEGPLSLVHKGHCTGLFSRGLWLRLRLPADAGFGPSAVTETRPRIARLGTCSLVGGRSPEPAPYRRWEARSGSCADPPERPSGGPLASAGEHFDNGGNLLADLVQLASLALLGAAHFVQLASLALLGGAHFVQAETELLEAGVGE